MLKSKQNKSKNNVVAKAMASDAIGLLEDLEATIQQLKSLETADNQGAMEMDESEGLEKAVDEIPDEENEDESMEMEENGDEQPAETQEDQMTDQDLIKAIKSLIKKTETKDERMWDGAEVEKAVSGRDDADERLDPDTLVNDESIPELGKVAKALKNIQEVQKTLMPKHNVKKISENITQQIQKALAPIMKAMLPIAQSVGEQGLALKNIMDALGYSKAIEETLKVEKSMPKQKPVQTTDTAAIANVFAEIFKAAQNQNLQVAKTDETPNYRQNLSDAMQLVFNKKSYNE